MEVVAGGSSPQIGPQPFHNLLAMQPMLGRERQELDKMAGFAPAPRSGRNRSAADHHTKPAKQVNVQRLSGTALYTVQHQDTSSPHACDHPAPGRAVLAI